MISTPFLIAAILYSNSVLRRLTSGVSSARSSSPPPYLFFCWSSSRFVTFALLTSFTLGSFLKFSYQNSTGFESLICELSGYVSLMLESLSNIIYYTSSWSYKSVFLKVEMSPYIMASCFSISLGSMSFIPFSLFDGILKPTGFKCHLFMSSSGSSSDLKCS